MWSRGLTWAASWGTCEWRATSRWTSHWFEADGQGRGQRVNLEVLVEERSAEQALRMLLPCIVPGIDFEIRVFQGKPDPLKRLPIMLRKYVTWIAQKNTSRVVLVGRDDDDCLELKAR